MIKVMVVPNKDIMLADSSKSFTLLHYCKYLLQYSTQIYMIKVMVVPHKDIMLADS